MFFVPPAIPVIISAWNVFIFIPPLPSHPANSCFLIMLVGVVFPDHSLFLFLCLGMRKGLEKNMLIIAGA